MNLASRTVVLLLGLASLAPIAAAKGGTHCTIDNADLCQAAQDARFTDMFGSAGDIVLIVVAFLVVALLINVLLWVVFHLKPTRLLKVVAGENLKEIEPGGMARYKFELENLNAKLPVDVFVERSALPDGWTQETDVSVLLPSGYRVPLQVAENESVTLSSEARGANKAQVTVRLIAPTGISNEETLDYEVRTVPIFRGRLRRGRAKKLRITVLVTPHVPVVQIERVQHNPARISPGNPVLTKAFLINKGDRPATDVAVSFTLNGQEIDKKILPALAAEGSAEVEFNWTPQTGENRIRVAIGT